MRPVVKVSSLVACALILSSCASYFTRKECEQIDWFNYGRSVAMQGKRLTGDETIKRCEEAEAEVNNVALDRGFKQGMETYCKPETVFLLGKQGEFFNVEMCDGEQPRFLQKRHADGVREFCAKTNGFTVGATGKKYNNICPKDLEGAFLPEFYRGRKKHLTAVIGEMENQVDDIDRDVRELESRRSNLTMQMATIGDGKKITRVSTYDPATRTQREELVSTVDEETKRRRESLESSINSTTRDIESKRSEQDRLRKIIREHRTELAGL